MKHLKFSQKRPHYLKYKEHTGGSVKVHDEEPSNLLASNFGVLSKSLTGVPQFPISSYKATSARTDDFMGGALMYGMKKLNFEKEKKPKTAKLKL